MKNLLLTTALALFAGPVLADGPTTFPDTQKTMLGCAVKDMGGYLNRVDTSCIFTVGGNLLLPTIDDPEVVEEEDPKDEYAS